MLIISAILESKLDSVPELMGSATPNAVGTATETEVKIEIEDKKEASVVTSEEQETEEVVVEENVKTVAEDERYSKYFKMVKMGVPLQVFFKPSDCTSFSQKHIIILKHTKKCVQKLFSGCEKQNGCRGPRWRSVGKSRCPRVMQIVNRL